MRKTFSKLLSVVIALVMVFSMTASAEATRIQVKLDTPSGVIDASLTEGFDADGCQQLILESAAIGEWLLQANAQAITLGSDENGYITINAEELQKAITALVNILAEDLPIEEIMAVTNYLTGPMLDSDMEAANAFIANEVNRFAAVAMEMGLVVISETGDLTVEAEYKEMVSLLAGYLTSLSQDDAAIGMALSLNIFTVLEIETAAAKAQAPAMIAAVAQELSASAAYAGEGGLRIFLAASGEMEIEVTTEEDGFVTTYLLKSDANGMNAKVSGVEGDSFVIFNLNADAEDTVFTIDYSADGNIMDIDYVVNAQGESLIGKIDMDDLHCTMNLQENASGSVVEYSLTSAAQTLTMKAIENAEGATCDYKCVINGAAETLEYDFDYVNNEFTFKYVNNLGYEPVKLVGEYIDEELYVEYNAEDKHILITGSKSYRVNATWSNYALSGVLRANDGLTFTGELTEQNSYSNFVLGMEFTLKDGVFTAKLNGTDGETVLNMTLEMKGTDTGIVSKIDIDFINPYGVTYQATVQYVFDFANSVITYAASINSEEMDVEMEYKYDFANLEFTSDSVYEIKMTNGIETYGYSFICRDGLLEYKLYQGEAEVRAFIESIIENGIMTVDGGVTTSLLSNPSIVEEAVALAMVMNLETLVHDVSLSVPVSNMLVESSFDGSVYSFVYDMNGEKVTATAKLVEESDNIYYLIEINAAGMPVVAKVGMKMISADEFRFYAEAEVNGETAGAAINMNMFDSDLLSSIAANLELYQSGMTQNLGGISVSVETLPEALEHVEGTLITADQLLEMMLSLF